MDKSYLVADHQPWIVRLLLAFCIPHCERRSGGWTIEYKTLGGKIYLVDAYHHRKPARRRFQILHKGR